MKKGFTLFELLAVIVIIAVISLITYTIVQKNIDVTKKSSFETSVKNLIEAAKEYVVTNYEENDFPEGGIDIVNNDLNIKNSEFISGIILKNDDGQIEVVNLTDGYMCANGTKNDLTITTGSCEATDKTPPTLEIKVLKKTPNKVRLLVKMQDAQSGLKELKYGYGDKESVIELPNRRSMVKKVIEISGLDAGKKYNFKFTLVNNYPEDNEKITTTRKEKEVELPIVEEPLFRISSGTYATTKALTIIYPDMEGYEYSYQKGNEEEKTLEAGKNETSFEIEQNTLVKAYIRKNGEEVISTKLMVTGLDTVPPTTKVYITDLDDPTKWVYDRKVYVKSADEGVGVALRGYSLDKKKTWVKTKNDQNLLTVLDAIQRFTLKTRDKVGNIQEKFRLCFNATFTDCEDEDREYVDIDHIDNLAPEMKIKVIEGELGSNNWYTSNSILVELTVRDVAYALTEDGQKTKVTGSGIKNVVIKENNKTLKLEPYSGSIGSDKIVYRFTLTKNNVYKYSFNSEDNFGNKSSGEAEIKKDDVRPTITTKATEFTGDVAINTDTLFKVTAGISGYNIVCNPSKLQTYRRTSATCTVTAGNGLTAEKSESIGYVYNATAHGHHVEHESCTEKCEWHDNGCCDSETHPGSTGSYSCTKSCHKEKKWVLDYYSCDKGGKGSKTDPKCRF